LHSSGGKSNFAPNPDGKASSEAASVFRTGNINIKKTSHHENQNYPRV